MVVRISSTNNELQVLFQTSHRSLEKWVEQVNSTPQILWALTENAYALCAKGIDAVKFNNTSTVTALFEGKKVGDLFFKEACIIAEQQPSRHKVAIASC